MKRIIGSGGGGGKGGGGGTAHVPSEETDSLQSKAYAQVLDLVCEGQIEGLVNGHQSILLDGTPLQNKDGSYNFSNVTIISRNGTQDQSYIPGFPSVESEFAVGVDVKYDYPITRTIINPNANAVRVGISIPQLTYQNPSTGDLSGSELTLAIEIQSNGAGYKEALRDRIIGKCVSKYEKKYRIELAGEPPWDIRIRRLSANASSVTTQNRLIFESYTEVTDAKLRYPNSALVGIRIDASQFSSIPQRAYEIKGLVIKIPSNYNPTTRSYTGAWDGTFYLAWSDNPAWVFYDLLTSDRYGLGGLIQESQIDKWALYSIAKYCDELVSDGSGGLEPRFTCNVYIQSKEEAYKVIQDFASVFRGMAYWASGSVVAVQDSPQDAAYLFSQANVVDGMFNYSGTSAKNRHTVALVAWNDPEYGYQQKIEHVEHPSGIAKYGVLETSVTAFGCTSRGQAHRVGRWLLYTEQLQTETVTFKTGLNGSMCRPGQVIKIADPVRAGIRLSGRVVDPGLLGIKVDKTPEIDPRKFGFSVMMPDGSVQTRQVLSVNGNEIILTTPLGKIPSKQAIWMLQSTEVEPQFFRIIGISEADNGAHEITAVAHNPDKYGYIENGLVLEPRKISLASTLPKSPTGLTITETLYETNSEIRVKATISWNQVSGAVRYAVQYQKDNLSPVILPESGSSDVEILNVEPGEYAATVWAINALGKRSTPSYVTKKIIGKTLPPGKVQEFSLVPSGGMAVLTWRKAEDLDVLSGGSIRIRHSPNIVNPVWKDSVDIGQAAGNSTTLTAPLLSGTYLAKFVDSSGVASTEDSRISTTVPRAMEFNAIETVEEGPNFLGAMRGMQNVPNLGGMTLMTGLTIDQITAMWDSIGFLDIAGGSIDRGEYDFEKIVDLKQVFSSRLSASLEVEGIDSADTFDQRIGTIDSWGMFDGDSADDVNARIFMSTTLDDPTSPEATWSEFKPFAVANYVARAFKFQIRATSEKQAHNIVIKKAKIVIDMPDRIFEKNDFVSGAETYQVTYDGAFFKCPTVGILVYDQNSGDYYRVTDETVTGFKITFYNSSNEVVSKKFGVIAKGYGKNE